MSRQLEIFEEIAERTAFTVNGGDRDGVCGGKIGSLGVSPALRRAKVARPAPDSPVASVDSPEAIPERVHVPGPRLVRNKLELVEMLRARKEFLNLSHESIDGLIGWADRYSSKVLSPRPRKGLSGESLQLLLDALALNVAAIVIVDDPSQEDRMRPRWPARGPSGPRPALDGALFGDCPQDMLPAATSTMENDDVET